VESITAARKQSLSGNEPTDALRVVNALLTQIDQIKTKPNVLILTTSNLLSAIDEAFLDRVDLKQYIGPSSAKSIYAILSECLTELSSKKIIQQVTFIFH
jgi:SpoVK/Ycf46/Vps4 family AAA+-type ATPase